MAGDRTPINFVALAEALLRRAPELLTEWLPGGHWEGHEYVGPSKKHGGIGDSLKINRFTGAWGFFAGDTSDSGGDLISLYAWLHGLNNGQAARELMGVLGWRRDDDDVQTPARAPAVPRAAAAPEPEPPPKDRWQSVLPVPPHAPRPTKFVSGFKNEKTGRWEDHEATRVWEYSFDGELFGWVARFERINSDGELVKDTKAYTWCQDTQDPRGAQRWHWKQWAAPRPLYVPATLLSGTPKDVPVVLVEGEKCAEAGHQLLGHEFDFVSWPGGCKAWALARWAWLLGRTVYLWPDCDSKRWPLTKAEREAGVEPSTKGIKPEAKQPGVAAMVGIGSLLVAEMACTVNLCAIPAPGEVADGWDIADAIAQGWDAAKVRDFIRGARPFVPPSDEARAKAAAVSTPSNAGASTDEADREWRAKLLTTEKGAIKAVRENVVLALDGLPEADVPGVAEAEGVIAFNEFTNDVVKLKAAPWGTPAGVWDETDELELGNWLVRQHWLPSMPRGTLEEAVAMVAKRHRYHPVRQQLDGLRGKWGGQKRLATWLRRCCLEEDEWDDREPLQQYLSRVGTWLVMAICARVLTPGCKFDYMVIFEGGQGVGKSTLARLLGGEYFADTGLVLGDKDSYQNLQGVLVYEWGELDSLSKAEVTKVKQFISSMKDRFRASFDRRAKDYPRQVVFIGTTNEDHYLVDPTGNRRMWPVRVTRQIDLDWFRENRAQLFAEALAYVEAGERFHPTTKEQRELFEPQQQQRQIENAIQAAVMRYLYDEDQRVSVSGENGTLVNNISAPELLSRLGISVDKQTHVLLRQATAALRQAGWVRYRSTRGDRPWMFRRPEGAAGLAAGASDSSTPPPEGGASTSGGGDEPPF